MVLFDCCLLPCCTLVFSLFLAHPSVFCFFDAVLLTCPSVFVVFLFFFPTCSHPLLARSFLDTIEPAGAPACSSGEWGWRPFGPRAKLRLRLVAPIGLSSAPLFVACVFVFVFWLSSRFFMRCLHMFFAPHCSLGDAFRLGDAFCHISEPQSVPVPEPMLGPVLEPVLVPGPVPELRPLPEPQSVPEPEPVPEPVTELELARRQRCSQRHIDRTSVIERTVNRFHY